MSRHSPAPWIVDEWVASQVRQPSVSKRRRIVCPPDAAGMADANLIAAAPDMLVALRKAYEYIDDGLHVRKPRHSVLNLAAEMRTAIAKAEAQP